MATSNNPSAATGMPGLHTGQPQERVDKPARELPLPLLGRSLRLQTLFEWSASESTADLAIQLHLDVESSSLAQAARLSDGLLDALESFFEGGRIDLAVRCPTDIRDQLSARLTRVPRLDLTFVDRDSVRESNPGLFDLVEDPTLVTALEAVLVAAASARDMSLLLAPGIFPIRPFSTAHLVDACRALSWRDRYSPLARRRRFALLDGPALFARPLAAAAVTRLAQRSTEFAAMPVIDRHAAILLELSSAELGFWAPDKLEDGAPPLIRRAALSELAWPWNPMPWQTRSDPLFLWLEDSVSVDCEAVLQRLYHVIHR